MFNHVGFPMFAPVALCLRIFPLVYLRFPRLTRVCIVFHSLLVFTYFYTCLPMITPVYLCLPMLTHVYLRLPCVIFHVYLFLSIFRRVYL